MDLIKKLLGIVVLGLFLSGCIASVSPTGGSFKGLKIEADKSRIVIIRRGGSLIGMDTPRLGIIGTTASQYYFPSKAFIQEEVIAGKYKISVTKPVGSTGLVWRFDPFEIEFVVKKNETIYLELKTSSIGFVHSAKIEVVDKSYALENIKSMQRVLRTDNP